MRAGPYAELAGRTSRCVSVNKPIVRLLEDGGRAQFTCEVVHEIPL